MVKTWGQNGADRRYRATSETYKPEPPPRGTVRAIRGCLTDLLIVVVFGGIGLATGAAIAAGAKALVGMLWA